MAVNILVQVYRDLEGKLYVVATNEQVKPIATFTASVFRWYADSEKSEKKRDILKFSKVYGANAYEIGNARTIDRNPLGIAIRDYPVTYHIIPEDARSRALNSPEREQRELYPGHF